MQLVCMKYEVEEGAAETVDETGLDYKDTELVISQAGCPRAVAITALKEDDGGVVHSNCS
jgi:NACalpha-BTF3-like transcription factor